MDAGANFCEHKPTSYKRIKLILEKHFNNFKIIKDSN
jgi:hypothetical protein